MTTLNETQLLDARLVAPRRPGRWISGALTLLVAAMLAHALLTNERFQWGVVGDYLFASSVIHGLELTLWLTAATMSAGFVLGVVIAYIRLWGSPIPRVFAFGYVWPIRSVPLLVRLLFWYELASLHPSLSVGIPFGPSFASARTAHLLSGESAAIITLTLDVAAFSSEIVRGGILSVDRGQSEAAAALGLGRLRVFRRIILPQAMPAIVPGTGNLLIATHVANVKFLSQVSSTKVGFVVAKGSPLAPLLAPAINELISDGEYATILSKWNIDGSGVTTSQVNPPANL